MDFSNKNLAVVLVVAIVVSLGGTIISLNKLNELSGPQQFTGRATSGTGQVNVTISSAAACTVDSNVDFGSGLPTESITLSSDLDNSPGFCDGDTAGTGDCWGLMINNTGNVKLNISYNSTKNGSGLLGSGHTEADFMWVADDTEIEANSCGYENSATWIAVSNAAQTNNSNVCANLNYTDASDVIVMDFNITVNQNTAPSATPKTATINIGCVDST